MKVYRITKENGNPLILDSLLEWDDIIGEIENDEVGDKYTITIEEMDEEKFKNLPEWDGFE